MVSSTVQETVLKCPIEELQEDDVRYTLTEVGQLPRCLFLLQNVICPGNLSSAALYLHHCDMTSCTNSLLPPEDRGSLALDVGGNHCYNGCFFSLTPLGATTSQLHMGIQTLAEVFSVLQEKRLRMITWWFCLISHSNPVNEQFTAAFQSFSTGPSGTVSHAVDETAPNGSK